MIETPRGSKIRLEESADGMSVHLIIEPKGPFGRPIADEIQVLLSADNVNQLMEEFLKVWHP